MFDLNWNEIICSRFEDDNLQIINRYFLTAKNKITEKQKDYIKNLFYQYYILNTERQFEYFENKLNELNTRPVMRVKLLTAYYKKINNWLLFLWNI